MQESDQKIYNDVALITNKSSGVPYPEAHDYSYQDEREPPRFMNQTFSCAQPSLAGSYSEAERVRNSFRTGSYWSLKKLPAQIEPGEISKLRALHTTQNLVVRSEQNSKNEMNALSRRTEKYIGTRYDKPDMLQKLHIDQQKYHIDSFSRRAFTVTATGGTHKGEGFVSPDFGAGAAIPGDCLARKPEESKFLFGPFYQNVPPIAKEVPKSKAKGWVKQLYAQLSEDWSGLIFSVKLTEQEIVIKFPTQCQALPAESALQKYMLRLASHGNPGKWGLRKRGDRWGVMEVPQTMLGDGERFNTSISDVLADQTANGEAMITFSYFLPWIKSGLRKVTKATGKSARDRVLREKEKKIAEEAAMEAKFQEEQAHAADLNVRRATGRVSMLEGNIHGFLANRRRATQDSDTPGRRRVDSMNSNI